MKTNYSDELKLRYDQVREKMELSAKLAGRDPTSVKLVVVTKTHPLEKIIAAVELGIKELGENYPEEAVSKIKAVGAVDGLHWHMIGHVQSRKADLVANNFSFVHSLDSLKLAERLNRFSGEVNRFLPVFIECNVSGEETKFGYPVYEKSKWDSLISEFEKMTLLNNLEIAGLMTMPPFFDDPEKTRPFFKKLREFRDYINKYLPGINCSELSMGTSTDFTAAIEEGSTIIRIGTAILGSRPAKI